jgi:S-adenosylmethionine uptake transporter
VDNASKGITFILLAMLCISVNDVLIKHLSGGYPLHQMVFVRSFIGVAFSLVMVQFEGGLRILRTSRPGWHTVRGLLVVVANMTYFAALAALPLADATAMFFVAPMFITLLSIPLLGEKVGVRRLSAVGVGFIGVLVMLRPGTQADGAGPGLLVSLLPVFAALAYACMQILTRRLGEQAKASAMAVYIQLMFIVVSGGFWIVAGDGRYAVGVESESAIFLLRAWVWPTTEDWRLFGLLGFMSAFIGYGLSQAYRSAAAATVAPFEYVALPLAIMWGWFIFGDLPDAWVTSGIVLIAGSGIYVFVRERHNAREEPHGDKARPQS